MKSDIIEQIRLQSERPFDETLGDEYHEMKKSFVIDRNVEYPEPEYLIEIGGTPTMPKGNLVALSAKWKNGKTFFCDIITAIFLGGDRFAGCRSLMAEGRALFFDTEQARSDTVRIQKTIDAMAPESRHGDYEVFCMREAVIDKDFGENEEVSRIEFIKRGIEHEHPDLVIIDGIADLIYNYNDVNESQDMVNKLAAIANKHDCCIVVVMHQNKGSHDKNMKGHLGTMLYQKCSDVFNIEKFGNIFCVTHAVSRHRNCNDIAFKLDDNAVPVDAVADRQQQLQLNRQAEATRLKEDLAIIFEDATVALRRSHIAEIIIKKLGVKRTKAFELIKKAIDLGVIKSKDGKYYYVSAD